MNRKAAIILYLNFVEDNLCFPLLGQLQKFCTWPEAVRYHIQTLIKDDVLRRNEYKSLLPSSKFIWFLESEGLLDMWLTTKAGALSMVVIGSGRSTGFTIEGIVASVAEDHCHIIWPEGSTRYPEFLEKRFLKKVWPVKTGDRLYVTEYGTKLHGMSKFK